MKFDYKARTKEGKIQTGIISASSKEAAAGLLQKYNLYVTSLKEAKTKIFSIEKIKFLKKVSKKDLAIFSRQLAVMLSSRVPVVQSLLSLASQTIKLEFKEKIVKVSELVREGNTLSGAFSHYPEIFDVFYISLIKAGEASGKISESLDYLSQHLEREHDISSNLRAAMIYPFLILFVLLSVLIIIMVGVMPGFVKLLEEIKTEPPLITRMMLGLYEFSKSFGWVLLIAFVAFIVFVIYYLKTKEGKKVYDKVSLTLPFIGKFFQKVFLIRFSENLSVLLSAGLPITKALGITSDIIGNFTYRKIISETKKKVSEGGKISSTLVKYPEVIPIFVIQMIKVGEDTGRLDKTLMEVVNFYQKEVKRGIDTFINLIEPILLIFLGSIVALLAVSVFLPLYGMLEMM